ncbi:unnamed protein product [Allacma fusca]|uniref:Uncharacterized protein n=1 Tax=Allacma fusca TaxID=39272 RepID=A0A8J2J9J4_9HEXA|nr:unnamed protein product [Allacma fusca]
MSRQGDTTLRDHNPLQQRRPPYQHRILDLRTPNYTRVMSRIHPGKNLLLIMVVNELKRSASQMKPFHRYVLDVWTNGYG